MQRRDTKIVSRIFFFPDQALRTRNMVVPIVQQIPSFLPILRDEDSGSGPAIREQLHSQFVNEI